MGQPVPVDALGRERMSELEHFDGLLSAMEKAQADENLHGNICAATEACHECDNAHLESEQAREAVVKAYEKVLRRFR